uniref:Major facilitator superfamily (MFS) profile domain-containing protein n=1 Tax=Plectus sambesii TaxID=2011161 RepID=A0A914VJ00_9BILA
PTIYHIFAETVPAEQRTRAFSYLAAAGSIGQTVAAIVSPHFSWEVPFYVFGALGMYWCIVWMRYGEDVKPSLIADQPLLCKQ